jgi:hypothetical protein
LTEKRKAGKQSELENLEEFDRVFVKTIDKTIRYVLGERNTLIIYNRLEKSSCPMQEIPRRLDLFSAVLRNLVGTDRGQMLGASAILEDVIVKALSSELGLKPEKESRVFEERIRRLKERYNNGRSRCAKNHCSK